MQKITPFLWFDDNAEDAIKFYSSIFKDTKVLEMHRVAEDKLLTASIEIEGQQLMLINGGPHYKLSPAISLYVNCDTQEEVDELWNKLSEGGQTLQCGWLTDRFGLSWQIIPGVLGQLLWDKDPVKAQRVMDAMMKMVKIDIRTLKDAHAGS